MSPKASATLQAIHGGAGRLLKVREVAERLPPINLQDGPSGKAKPYQVAQVLAILDAAGIVVD